METRKILTILVLALGLMFWSSGVSMAEPMGTVLTYQGHLMDANGPVDGLFDFTFGLYDTAADGNKVASANDINDLDVIEGYVNVELDFGIDVFTGDTRWLEIGVRPGGSNDVYTTLSPRQKITYVPYSLQTRGIYVDPNGNVGLGTTSPTEKLHVNGNLKVNNIELGHGDIEEDGSVRIIIDQDNNENNQTFTILTDGTTELLRIQENGNVGIGTTSPTQRLHVSGSIRIVDGSEGVGRVLTSDATGVANWQSPIPRGVIVMWSGLLSNIPGDWALCDGGTHTAPNGDQVTTPNLISRFIRSIPDASTDPGSTGGFSNHSHGSGSYSGAGHSHSYSGTTSQGGNVEYCCSENMKQVPSRNTHTHTYSGTTSGGGGGAVSGTSGEGSSLPPYFALAFIMKL